MCVKNNTAEKYFILVKSELYLNFYTLNIDGPGNQQIS